MNSSDEAVGETGPDQAAASLLRAALPLASGRCLLRTVAQEDLLDIQSYRGRPEVSRFLGHPPLDEGSARELVTGWLEDRAALTVVAEHEGHVVGDVRLRFRPSSAMAPATTAAVEAALGYAFHPRVHGRGIATECVRAVVDLALSAGAARRITARVFAPAVRSSALLARIGFTRDGVDRRAVLAADGHTWWDDELWSRLAVDDGHVEAMQDRSRT